MNMEKEKQDLLPLDAVPSTKMDYVNMDCSPALGLQVVGGRGGAEAQW